MTRTLTLSIALGALLLCSACADRAHTASTATLITPTSQQVAAVKWDEVVAAQTTVRVGNSSLISMR